MESAESRSIIGSVFTEQKFAIQPFDVLVVVSTRTFLEKIFLLDEEFLKPRYMIRHLRMTKHLNDLERLMDISYGMKR